MPYKTEWVDPEVFLTHNDVSVYHTYDGDQYENESSYWFTTNEDENNLSSYHFDLRDQPESVGISDRHLYARREEVLKRMIERGVLIQNEHPDETRDGVVVDSDDEDSEDEDPDEDSEDEDPDEDDKPRQLLEMP